MATTKQTSNADVLQGISSAASDHRAKLQASLAGQSVSGSGDFLNRSLLVMQCSPRLTTTAAQVAVLNTLLDEKKRRQSFTEDSVHSNFYFAIILSVYAWGENRDMVANFLSTPQYTSTLWYSLLACIRSGYFNADQLISIVNTEKLSYTHVFTDHPLRQQIYNDVFSTINSTEKGSTLFILQHSKQFAVQFLYHADETIIQQIQTHKPSINQQAAKQYIAWATSWEGKFATFVAAIFGETRATKWFGRLPNKALVTTLNNLLTQPTAITVAVPTTPAAKNNSQVASPQTPEAALNPASPLTPPGALCDGTPITPPGALGIGTPQTPEAALHDATPVTPEAALRSALPQTPAEILLNSSGTTAHVVSFTHKGENHLVYFNQKPSKQGKDPDKENNQRGENSLRVTELDDSPKRKPAFFQSVPTTPVTPKTPKSAVARTPLTPITPELESARTPLAPRALSFTPPTPS